MKFPGLIFAVCLGAPMAQAACGADPAACSVTEGTYHVVLPDGPGPHLAVLFLHGYGGSGEASLRNTGMVDVMVARGYAVIAPDGQQRPERDGRSWDFHPDRPATRDEAAFLQSVADDAAQQFDLDRDRMILSGFSIGGSLTTYVACVVPDAFAAYAPVGGSFWRPHPTGCAGPVRLFHTHGWTDGTVPLEGRALGSGFMQGDVFESLQILRAASGCALMRPDDFAIEGTMQIRTWTSCLPGGQLGFALHPGGHSIPQGWATLALDWYEAGD